MVEIELIVASQRRRPQFNHIPEYRLMIAVLENALHCLDKHRLAHNTRSQQLFQETKAWVLAEEADWLYSFAGICSALELNPGAVRQQLLRPNQLEERDSSAPAAQGHPFVLSKEVHHGR